jgi:hypothetical protein
MLRKIISLFSTMMALPQTVIRVDRSETGSLLYRAFTKRHPKYVIFKQKTIGVGIIHLDDFSDQTAYTASVNGKNSAAYFSRKAQRASYRFEEINPTKHHGAILEINNSMKVRQGRKMDSSYTENLPNYPLNVNNAYFGIFNNDALVAYLWVVKAGELALLNRLLGHAEHLGNGVMYLLVTSYVEHEITARKGIRFVMYDTFFGASEGLQLFKSRCGFRPYKVKWLQE